MKLKRLNKMHVFKVSPSDTKIKPIEKYEFESATGKKQTLVY